jgi:hypothetical protein
MLNEGVTRMYDKSKGVRAQEIFYTVVGQADYILPTGTLYIEKVWLEDYPLRAMSFRALTTEVPSTSNTNRPLGYVPYPISNNGQPTLALILVPSGADQVYTIKVNLFRSPFDMTELGDSPELPKQFQWAPAYWAGLQMAIADGNPTAQMLGSIFTQMQKDHAVWQQKVKITDRFLVSGENTYGAYTAGGYT